jgi:histidinol-phosphate aminotransferase
MTDTKTKRPIPSPNVRRLTSYAVPRAPAPTDLKLDANEGASPPAELLQTLPSLGPELFCRYQKPRALEEMLAESLGIAPEQVLVTAGGDEAIDRACRAFLFPNREMVLPTPAFEMFTYFAQLSGGRIKTTSWRDDVFPLEAVIKLVGENTGIIVVTSPNNPTGAVISADELTRLSAACPHALLLVDLAYGPFAEEDLTPVALRLPNAVVVHSFSKAHGMAGLRVGFAAGPAPIIDAMRAAGAPYPVSTASHALAVAWFRQGRTQVDAHVARVRRERAELIQLLVDLDSRPVPSQANFVFTYCRDALWLRDALAGLGIAIRLILPERDFAGGVRITCPGEERSFERLGHALRTILRPQALLFDMDGVLAEVSRSYRAAIASTAESFGVALDAAEITAAKAEDGANDDWEVTRRLLARHGVNADLAEVTSRFEDLYQGTGNRPGLRELETLRPDRLWLERLARRLPLGIVTGRPRPDAERFLRRFEVADLFRVVVCREDAPLKPDPAPVRLALKTLGVEHAWLVGDTPDDIRAARAARVLPLGLAAVGDDPAATAKMLYTAGAARVLNEYRQLEELLP